jgi:hypothetical protein
VAGPGAKPDGIAALAARQPAEAVARREKLAASARR